MEGGDHRGRSLCGRRSRRDSLSLAAFDLPEEDSEMKADSVPSFHHILRRRTRNRDFSATTLAVVDIATRTDDDVEAFAVLELDQVLLILSAHIDSSVSRGATVAQKKVLGLIILPFCTFVKPFSLIFSRI